MGPLQFVYSLQRVAGLPIQNVLAVQRSVVIIFASQDASAARRLQRFLAAFRTPKRLVGRASLLGQVPDRIAPHLLESAENGFEKSPSADSHTLLRESSSLVVMCSPHSAASASLNELIKAFKKLGRADRILCVIVAGEPNATNNRIARASEECFAPALQFALGADGNLSDTRVEPIAADVRPGKDRWRDACLKIAAGIAGVGYDELKQRALRRRLRLAAAAAAVVFVLLTTTLVLAVIAVVNQRVAAQQRVEALAAEGLAQKSQVAAERSRKVAEIRSSQAKAMVVSHREALSIVGTTKGMRSGLGVRAVDVLSHLHEKAKHSSSTEPKFEDAASLIAVAQSMNALRQPKRALSILDSADAILARLSPVTAQTASMTPRLRFDLQTERVAALLALDRIDDADDCISRLRRDGSDEIAADERLSLRMDLLTAELEMLRNRFEEAGRLYDSLAARLQKSSPPNILALTATEVGRARVAIKHGDLDFARGCISRISELDAPGLSRQGTLHELYAELAAAMVAKGDRTGAVAILKESLAIARKVTGDIPVTLVPQLLTLAELTSAEHAAYARRCQDDGLMICLKWMDHLCPPDAVERNAVNLSHVVAVHAYLTEEYFIPTFTRCLSPEYLADFGPDALVSIKRHFDSLTGFVDRSSTAIQKQGSATPEWNQAHINFKARLAKMSGLIAAQIPPLLSAADSLPPPAMPAAVTAQAGVITNSVGMVLVPIAPGEFLMGSPADEPLGNSMEELIHRVAITKSFFMGAHEVTQAQYLAVTGHNPSVFKGDNLPVEHVSWADAAAFCDALSQLPAEREAGRRYRLPTEAQWEYCCRAGTNTPYHTGKRLLPSQARYAFCERARPKHPAPVGSYPPNAWGLHDMHGNVWEWTNDWFSATYYGSMPQATDPTGPVNGIHHTLRGGSASVLPTECHAAIRGEALADQPDEKAMDSRFAFLGDFGFRVTCEISANKPAAVSEETPP